MDSRLDTINDGDWVILYTENDLVLLELAQVTFPELKIY